MSHRHVPLLSLSPGRSVAVALAAASLGALALPLHATAATGSPTTTTLSTAQNSSTHGERVAFTLRVNTSVSAPTGVPGVMENGTFLSGDAYNPHDGYTSHGPGEWIFTTSALSVGTHHLTGWYGGDSANSSSTSSPALSFVVTQFPTGVQLVSSSNPSVPGQHVTIEADTVTPPGPSATGTITFQDGGTEVGTAPLDQNGAAVLTTTALESGTHEMTATYSGDADNLAATSAPLNQTVAPATPAQRFVNQMYNDILNRPADDGAASWVTMLDQHRVSRTQVALALSSSTEYLTDQIQGAYLAHLGRPADQPGLDFWIGYLRRGARFEDLEVSFLGTPEYYANAGGSPGQFVLAVYRDVLGRDPDTHGNDYWDVRLETGTPSWVVATSVVRSNEAMSNRVTDDYLLLLGRDPDSAGLGYWVSLLQHGTRDETLLGFLAGSDEYWTGTQTF